MIILITSKCRAVANYIIEKSNEYNEDRTFGKYEMMSCKRLQRLLYFCNVKYMLLQNGEFLFESDFKSLFNFDNVLEQTKDIATFDLIKISNDELWERYYDNNDFEHNQIIPKDEICKFYLDKEIKFLKKDKTLIKKRQKYLI